MSLISLVPVEMGNLTANLNQAKHQSKTWYMTSFYSLVHDLDDAHILISFQKWCSHKKSKCNSWLRSHEQMDIITLYYCKNNYCYNYYVWKRKTRKLLHSCQNLGLNLMRVLRCLHISQAFLPLELCMVKHWYCESRIQLSVLAN